MIRARVKMRLVTPTFLGGAINETPEIRPSSIKSLLRFWFRALHYNDYLSEHRLFGGVQKIGDQEAGQSRFILRISISDVRCDTQSGSKFADNPAFVYLGYGPVGKKDARNCLKAGGEFVLSLFFKDAGHYEDLEQVLRSLWALCRFGGVGSRSRRGFGSLEYLDYDGPTSDILSQPRPASADAYLQEVRARIASWCPQLPAAGADYTCFCAGTRVIALAPVQDGQSALADIGNKLMGLRSWTRGKGYPADHHLILKFIQGGQITSSPERASFGLPHNYFYRSLRRRAFVSPVTSDSKSDRRASPLFLHIQPTAVGFVPVASFFPVRFLPSASQIKIKTTNPNHEMTVPPPPDYAAITKFLDALVQQGGKEVRL